MRLRQLLSAALLAWGWISSLPALADPPLAKVSPTIPDTPAGRTLRAWLDAFNSGDPAKFQAYRAIYEPKSSGDGWASFREQTGGFELLSVDKSERLRISFQVKEKSSARIARGRLDVTDGDPPHVAKLWLRAIPAGMSAAAMDVKIDAAIRKRVIDGAITSLLGEYVFLDKAKKMVEALRTHEKEGAYDAIVDAQEFASLLSDHLQEVTRDPHLRVDFSPQVLPKDLDAPDPKAQAEANSQLERDNCGFEKVERLANNVGYVKLDMFGDAAVCGPTAAAAMGFLAHVDALIFDLRENGGGDPAMVAFLSSYLFDEPTHLNDLYNRKRDSTQQYWTLPYIPGKRFADKPVFVLTSGMTFSAAEEFSYNLKSLKRATIVGELTAGGAHPTDGRRLDDHFLLMLPVERAVNPITKTDWEGVGVIPDVKVAARDALDAAKKLAADKLKSTTAQ
ncbi:MAG: S41 family peptidase [Deltaproteobacteria bacterium]|nr:S41 family peptidase [Deltaproteobacteria bacterium]